MIEVHKQQIIGKELSDLKAVLNRKGYYTTTENGMLFVSLNFEQHENYRIILIDETASRRPMLKAFCKHSILSLNNYSEKNSYLVEKGGKLCVSKYLGTDNICAIIRYLLKSEESHTQMSRSISRILLNIGIQAHYKGYKYIKSAIQLSVEDSSLIRGGMMRLYVLVAEKYEADSKSVEHAIRNAIENAYRNVPEKMHEYFGIERRPRSSELISAIAEGLLLNREQ